MSFATLRVGFCLPRQDCKNSSYDAATKAENPSSVAILLRFRLSVPSAFPRELCDKPRESVLDGELEVIAADVIILEKPKFRLSTLNSLDTKPRRHHLSLHRRIPRLQKPLEAFPIDQLECFKVIHIHPQTENYVTSYPADYRQTDSVPAHGLPEFIYSPQSGRTDASPMTISSS